MLISSITLKHSHNRFSLSRLTVTVLICPPMGRCLTNLYFLPRISILFPPNSFQPVCLSVKERYFFTFWKAGLPPCPAKKRRAEEHTSELQSPLNIVCRL